MAAATVELVEFGMSASDPKGANAGFQYFRVLTANSNLGEDGDLLKCLKMHRARLPIEFNFWTQNLDSHATAPTQAIAWYFTDGTTKIYLVGSATEGSLISQELSGGVIGADLESYPNWFLRDIFDSEKWELRAEVITSAATEATGLYGGFVRTIGIRV